MKTSHAAGVERSDAPAGRIALFLAGLIAALLLVCAGVAGMLLLFDRHAAPEAPPPLPALVSPEPRLQVFEPAQRRTLARHAKAQLAARPDAIGIDAAMNDVAHEGWRAPEGPAR